MAQGLPALFLLFNWKVCVFMHTELSEIAPGLAVSGRLMAGSVHNLVCRSGAFSLPPLVYHLIFI